MEHLINLDLRSTQMLRILKGLLANMKARKEAKNINEREFAILLNDYNELLIAYLEGPYG